MAKNSQVLGANIWWQWVSHKQDPWEKLWHSKYAQGKPKQDLIRFNEIMQGSHIWNYDHVNRGIIQYHRFLEIRKGHDANFWTDS